MKRTSGFCFLFVLCLLLPIQAKAEEYVLCMQNQLKELGYDPGPLDGFWGAKTKAAALASLDQEEQLQGNPMLQNPRGVSAVSWCRILGEKYATVRKFRPSVEKPVFLFDKEATSSSRALIRISSRQAHRYFRYRHRVDLAGRIDVVAGSDHKQISSHLITLQRKRHEPTSKVRQDTKKRCQEAKTWNAAAYSNQIYVCWPKDIVHDSNWLSRWKHFATTVMVHEYAHAIQKELSLDKTHKYLRPDGRRIMGPNWLVEGSAMMLALDYSFPGLKGDRMPAFFTIQWPAKKSSLKLSDIKSVSTNEEYAVSKFAAFLLVKRFGIESMIEYWRQIGQGNDWNKAFQNTFGMSLKEYEREFETLRQSLQLSHAFVQETS